jgi:hypothetical protein
VSGESLLETGIGGEFDMLGHFEDRTQQGNPAGVLQQQLADSAQRRVA